MRRTATIVSALALTVAAFVGPGATGAAAMSEIHTVGVVDTSMGLWHMWDPLEGSVSFYYGNPGDLPFVGDWDCNGVETPGLYRQSDGFVYLRNSNTQGIADIRFFFGNPGDVPLAGDFDGDGCDTVSVYRPSEGRVFVINELGANEGGLGAADFDYYFGNPGDDPFVGDFDGDGMDTIGLHRVTTGRVYFRNSHTAGIAESDFIYGDPGDAIVAGDWTGDGTDTVGIFRPSQADFFLRYANTLGVADEVVLMDIASGGLLPVAGALGRTGTVSFAAYPCSTTGYTTSSFEALAPSPAPAVPSDAVGVLGMSFTRGPTCERAVIALGAADSFTFTGVTVPANVVPAGVIVGVDGNRVNAAMTGIERGRVSGMDFLADPYSFVVRERFPKDDLYVDVHYSDYRRASAMYLSDPARIVIDSVGNMTPPGRLGPILGDGVVLRDPIDPTGAGVSAPVTVIGYARPFEASAPAFLTDAATGAPVVATWSGCEPAFVVPPNTGCVYGTSDYIEAWGEFSFTFDVGPGTYELAVTGFEDIAGTGAVFEDATDRFTIK